MKNKKLDYDNLGILSNPNDISKSHFPNQQNKNENKLIDNDYKQETATPKLLKTPRNDNLDVLKNRKIDLSSHDDFTENNLNQKEEIQKEIQENSLLHFAKIFVSKLRNATYLKNIKEINITHIPFIKDLSYDWESFLDNNSLLVHKKKIGKLALCFKKKIFSPFQKMFLMSCSLKISNYFNENIIFHPYQHFKIFWEIMIALIIIFGIFYIPLLFAFEEAQGIKNQVNIFSLLIFFFDIFINFNTSYFKKGLEERKRGKIIKNYLKTQFFFDFVTLFPLLLNLHIDYSGEAKLAIRFFNFLFYFKIFQLRTILHRINEKFMLQEKIQNILSLLKVLFVSLLVAHVFACFWFFIGSLNTHESWIIKAGIIDAPASTKYLYSIYWSFVTMMTVGYGDIGPQNNQEMILCLICVVLGCAVYAYNINSIGMILQEMNKENANLNHNINIINNFMQRKNINQNLQMRIREYLTFIWKEEKMQNLEEEQKIIGFLSAGLKEELLMEAYGGTLMKFPLFYANFTQKSLRKVINIFQNHKLFPQEKIFQEAETDDCSIYFIKKGKVQLFTESGIIIRELGAGECFGEIAFFSGQERKLSARSKGFTTLFSINREQFLKILIDNPDDFEKFCMIKDQIILYSNYFPLKIRCFACNQMGHLAMDCPEIHFAPDIEKIIKKYNFYEDQPREKGLLRRNTRINAIKNFHSILIGSKKLEEEEREKKLLYSVFGKKLSGSSDNSSFELDEVSEVFDTINNDNEEFLKNFKNQTEIKKNFKNQTTAEVELLSEIDVPSKKELCFFSKEISRGSHIDQDEDSKSDENEESSKSLNFKDNKNKRSDEELYENIFCSSDLNICVLPEKELSRNLNPNFFPPNADKFKKNDTNIQSSIELEMSRNSIEKIFKSKMLKNSLKNANKGKNPSQTHLNLLQQKSFNSKVISKESLDEVIQKENQLFSQAAAISLDNFEKVAHFKNYFIEDNCRDALKKINSFGVNFSRKVNDNKVFDAHLSKYTFFTEKLKEKMTFLSKKSMISTSKLRGKRSLKKYSEKNKKRKALSKFNQRYQKFSDLALYIMKNSDLKKQIKK